MNHFFLDFLEILKEFSIQFQQKVSLALQICLLVKDLFRMNDLLIFFF